MNIRHSDTSLDPEKMRTQMRNWATGVAIVSSAFEGQQHGMTINSFTSLSLNPPQVLVSLEKGTRTHEYVEKSGSYAVSLLNSNQKDISERFAGKESEEGDRFEDLDFLLSKSGNPILVGGLAYFDCRVINSYDAGTHTFFVAEVMDTGAGTDNGEGRVPLIYYDGGYYKLGTES
jgi:flavin reductase (DIM6/NTAB) family NADH-FMN oxidoreductase RutF